ncbi:MAG: hypothetical protein NTY80_03350 [candidate division SR1 bacterium]|nr:hypothetical protein [candidate division SR1 bacterium]
MRKSLVFVLVPVLLVGVFVFAEDNNGTGSNNESGNRQEFRAEKDAKSVFTGLSVNAIACVTTAVTKRDAAISLGMDAYHATWTSTFNARTTAFVAALSLTNKKEMKKAMDLAWKNTEKAMKAAQKIKKDGVQAAWGAYRIELKVCNTDTAKGLMLEKGGNDLDD